MLLVEVYILILMSSMSISVHSHLIFMPALMSLLFAFVSHAVMHIPALMVMSSTQCTMLHFSDLCVSTD